MQPDESEINDSKRKRDSSNNSSGSSLSIIPKKHKEDFNVSLDNSVFSPPTPMASGHNPHSANAPLAGEIIPEASRSSESSSHSTSVGMMSANDSSTHSSPLSHSALSQHSSNSRSLADRDVRIDSASQDCADLIRRFPDPEEAKSFISHLMKVNNDEFRSSVNGIVKDAMDERFTLFESRVVPQIKQDVYMAVKHDMDTQNDDIRRELTQMRLKYDQLEQRMDRERLETRRVEIRSVENDQYARRNTIRIRGIVEHPGEDLKHMVCHIVYYQFSINIQLSDIELIHRAGVSQPRKNRVILCRFKDRGLKYAIMMQRKNLKGTGIYFEEYLTKEYDDILYSIKDHPSVSRAWSWNGKVMAQDIHGKKHNLRFGADWVSFFDNLANVRPHSNQRSVPAVSTAAPNPAVSAAAATTAAANITPPQPAPPPPPPPPPTTTQAIPVITTVSSTLANTSVTSSATAQPTTVTPSTQSGPIASASVSAPLSSANTLGSLSTQGATGLTISAGTTPSNATAFIPPLQVPLKDIGQLNGMGDLLVPPYPTRFPGSPVITASPVRRARSSTPFGNPPDTQRPRAPRTPRGQSMDRRPSINPSISSFFTKPP